MTVERADILTLLKSAYPFRKLSEAELDLVADVLTPVPFQAGQVIYLQNEDYSDSLYIVYSGEVSESQMARPNEARFATRVEGDFLGLDALENSQPRKSTARAEKDTILLRAESEAFAEVVNALPFLRNPLHLMFDSYRLSLKVSLSWMEPGENLRFIARRSNYFLIPRLLPPLLAGLILIPALAYLYFMLGRMTTVEIMLGVVVLGLAGWVVWNYIDWSNDYSIITDQRVVYQEKVVALYDSRDEAPLDAVLAVSLSTDQLGRILSYGNVLVKTYTDTLRLPDIGYPKEVQSFLELQIVKAKEGRVKTNKEAILSTLRTRLKGNQTPAQAKKGVEQTVQSEGVSSLMSNMFRMRFEAGGVITYRTHWFILLRNIFLPTLLLFGMLALLVARWVNAVQILSPESLTGLVFLLMMLAGVWWWYQYEDWHNDIYVVTQDQIIDIYKKPLGREDRKAAPLKNIQSIDYDRHGLLGLILNYGTVFIRIGDADFTFDNVFNPSEVQRELFSRFNARNRRERQSQDEADRQRIADYLEAYHRLAQEMEQGGGLGQSSEEDENWQGLE